MVDVDTTVGPSGTRASSAAASPASRHTAGVHSTTANSRWTVGEGRVPADTSTSTRDALACRVYPQPHARALEEAFLARDFPHRPEVIYFIYFIYSYCRSYIDDAAFGAFLEALRRRFDARVERLNPLPAAQSNREHALTLKPPLRRTITAPLQRPQRWLTDRLEAVEGGDDLAFHYPPRSAGVEGEA